MNPNALITLGDVEIKFEPAFLQNQNQRRLTDLTKAPLPFSEKKKTSRLATVHVIDVFLTVKLSMSRPVSSVGRASDF